MEKFKHISYIHFDTIDSTNTWTKNNAHTLDPDQLTCITAQEQTAGKGRRGRKWFSSRGNSLLATLYFCLKADCKHIPNIGQILSLSCAKILKNKGFSPHIKWPNDLLLQGKKVAGILCETISLEDRVGVILGIGLNVNVSKELLDSVGQPATSLGQLSGQTWTTEQILDPLLLQFLKDLNQLLKEGFEPFLSDYESLLAYKGKSITCDDEGRTLQGICHSINANGTLNLHLPSGKLAILSSCDLKLK